MQEEHQMHSHLGNREHDHRHHHQHDGAGIDENQSFGGRDRPARIEHALLRDIHACLRCRAVTRSVNQ